MDERICDGNLNYVFGFSSYRQRILTNWNINKEKEKLINW